MSEKDASDKNNDAADRRRGQQRDDHPAGSSASSSDSAAGDAASDVEPASSSATADVASQESLTESAPADSNPKSSGRGLAAIALLLSIGALVGVGWLLFQSLQGPDQDPNQGQDEAALADAQAQLLTLDERLAEIAAAQQTLQDRLAADLSRQDNQLSTLELVQDELEQLQQQADASRSNSEAFEASLSEQAQEAQEVQQTQRQQLEEIERQLNEFAATQNEETATLSGIESRLDRLAQSLQQQQGVQREVDIDLALKLDLMETAAVLSIAQARIELVGDTASALRAYRLANQQIASISDSRLSQVREQIADEMNLIESLGQPDWAQISATLAQWERGVDAWPLNSDQGSTTAGQAAIENDPEAGWFSGVRQSLGQLVKVERRDGLALDAEIVVAIREQLRLNLAAAGLALERRDLDALAMRAGHIGAILDEFFAIDAAPLSDVRTQLDALTELSVPAPPAGVGQAAAALDRVIDSL